MVMKHVQITEYAKTLKELLQEMKVERMVKRRIDDGGNLNESDEVDEWFFSHCTTCLAFSALLAYAFLQGQCS
jgi:hypothetical protein